MTVDAVLLELRKYLLTVIERTVLECLVGPIVEVFQFQRLLVGVQLMHSKVYNV